MAVTYFSILAPTKLGNSVSPLQVTNQTSVNELFSILRGITGAHGSVVG
jgi:hypothetical protein